MNKITITPTQEQLNYLEDVLQRMDTNFENDWGGSPHKSHKYWGKLAEIITADLFNITRPHADGQRISFRDDPGYDLEIQGYKVDVKTQAFWAGYGNVNPKCCYEKKCDYFLFWHHNKQKGTLTLKGGTSWESVADSPIVEGKYTPMHQATNLGFGSLTETLHHEIE